MSNVAPSTACSKSYFIFVLAILSISSLLSGLSWGTRVNSLENNGDWIPTKCTLSRYVMCSEGYLKGPQPLHAWRLNLGAWHGFQEVIHKRRTSPAEVQFKFLMPKSSYFYFIFNKDDSGFSGIRINAGGSNEGIFFNALDNGKFTRVESYPNGNVKAGAWNDCLVEFSTAGVALRINGRFVQSFDDHPKETQSLGFRGSSANVLIDDVKIFTADNSGPIKESFCNLRQITTAALSVFLAAILGTVLLALFPYLKNPRATCFAVTLFHLNFLVFSLLFFAANFYLTGRYPQENSFLYQQLHRSSSRDWIEKTVEEINEHIPNMPKEKAVQATKRVILLGSSQAWGSGAKTEEETIARRLEHFLNEKGGGEMRYECTNAGISSVESTFLLERYKSSWTSPAPYAAVIILSNNDKKNVEQFRTNLRKFADINKSLSIKTVFVLEASSPEYPNDELASAHIAMEQVGNENGILTLDAHAHLKAKQNEGILWWDYIHLTAFGQDLLARYIHDHAFGD